MYAPRRARAGGGWRLGPRRGRRGGSASPSQERKSRSRAARRTARLQTGRRAFTRVRGWKRPPRAGISCPPSVRRTRGRCSRTTGVLRRLPRKCSAPTMACQCSGRRRSRRHCGRTSSRCWMRRWSWTFHLDREPWGVLAFERASRAWRLVPLRRTEHGWGTPRPRGV